MSALEDEIRINPYYTQLVQSEFPTGSAKDDSIAKIRKHVIPTDKYLEKISKGFGSIGVLPPNCRYIEPLDNGHLVVIEEPPAYRTIKVQYNMRREIDILRNEGKLDEYGLTKEEIEMYSNGKNMPYHFTLAFPYTIFILMFDRYSTLMGGQSYLRNARLAGLSDYLLKIPMMNISSEQSICFGDDRNGERHRSLNAAIEHTIMVFWSAEFNADYIYNYSAYKNVAGVNTYIGWQALSRIDPMFIYNVDWIKMDLNLHETIERMKEHWNNRSKTGIQYRELSQSFTQPVDTGREEKPTEHARKTQPLFYDIAQGIYLTDTFYIHVGDPVVWGKKIAHVSSFIGFYDSDQIRYVQLEIEGKLINVKYNKKVRELLHKGAYQLRFQEKGVLKNGIEIKKDDIIVIKDHKNRDLYKKVCFIRKARDGITEARLGNSFYILENIEGNVLNINKPEYNGIKLNKETNYLLLKSISGGVVHRGCKVQYKGVNVKNTGSLILEFESKDEVYGIQNHTLDMDNQRDVVYQSLYEMKDVKPMPEIFRVGRKLLCFRFNDELRPGCAWGIPEGIVYNSNFYQRTTGSYSTSYPKIQEIIKYLLSEDRTVFHVESFDLDITFKVGDKVVYADWNNPINMLIPRTITAFKTESDTGDLYFVLEDKEGHLTQVKYISGQTSRGRSPWINVGMIRKITNKYGRVTAGTKIIANEGYIPHFPKKDVNIIIGFITDTGGDDPLVLCSNCCTLWYSDMMKKFRRITMKSKKWAQLPHSSVDITKIKPQPGDIINGTTDYKQRGGWLVAKSINYRTPRIWSMNSYTGSPDSYALDNYVKNHISLQCIPNPRFSPTEQNKMESVPAWPNFHGLFIESKISPYRFLKDERSLMHVSNSRK